jgi:hypothetical protein
MTRAFGSPRRAGWGALFALCVLAAPALAETPIPHPPHGKGEHCVADTAFMRRNHMQMMFAHRTEAVHEGVRAPKFSLAGCVSCHAVKGEDGKPVSYASDKHFCRSCHAYAAVRIDCFECHKSTPDEPAKAASAKTGADADKLAAYLREVKP